MEKKLPIKWQSFLATKPETGMGYQVVNLTLADGGKIENVVIIQSAIIGEVKGGDPGIDPDKIIDVELTHNKWKFRR